ncbi:MAG: helix-turn-helix domain-containing protein [Peptococcaceae bacterium]|nr:helix-turn-helix domain-containing protein [Peptococcaceae bacterium]
MPRKFKIEPSLKLELVQAVIAGRLSQRAAARRAGVHTRTLSEWVRIYRTEGAQGLLPTTKNRVYDPVLKKRAVEDYLSGGGSLSAICEKYEIHSHCQLLNWIKVYTTHGDFSKRNFSGGGMSMSKSRKVSQEEKLAIVKDCIAGGENYGATAKKYTVSYQQVRNWTIRFKEYGEAGLEDRRGKRKKDQEPRTELEKAQIEIERLKHELYMAEMENNLLKNWQSWKGGMAL